MTGVDWYGRILESELAYSEALGGEVERHDRFIHIYNPHVPFSGDYNRAVDLKVSDFESYLAVTGEVERIHRQRGLDPPAYHFMAPPALPAEVWAPFVTEHGHTLREVWYMSSPAARRPHDGGHRLYTPEWGEYESWYRESRLAEPWFEEQVFSQILPRQRDFIKVFRPYWFMRGTDLLGSVYAADLGAYWRLFDVHIREELRGQGLGTTMLELLIDKAACAGTEQLLISVFALDRLRNYYERLGFAICGHHSAVWRNTI